MSYVRLPSNRSYSSSTRNLSNCALPPSSQKGQTHPPSSNLADGSSSGPPGACMTPSSESMTAPVSLRIDGPPGRDDGFTLNLRHASYSSLGYQSAALPPG